MGSPRDQHTCPRLPPAGGDHSACLAQGQPTRRTTPGGPPWFPQARRKCRGHHVLGETNVSKAPGQGRALTPCVLTPALSQRNGPLAVSLPPVPEIPPPVSAPAPQPGLFLDVQAEMPKAVWSPGRGLGRHVDLGVIHPRGVRTSFGAHTHQEACLGHRILAPEESKHPCRGDETWEEPLACAPSCPCPEVPSRWPSSRSRIIQETHTHTVCGVHPGRTSPTLDQYKGHHA